ncbi:MAG TPA: GNAT family N-acetyltransferase [Anaerovoracaceae bacterium]|nr:GNAT family N-acetyltransferase [Anaerovoracaceae bacterium]
MLQLKAATVENADLLSELAYCSEAYWGNDNEYMDQFRLYYNVTKEFIQENPVFVLEENHCTVGFWGLKQTEADWELEFFYIGEPYIGKGYGRRLWNSLIEECSKSGIKSFEFVTSPEAVHFYEKMGAKTICNVESFIRQGRIIPRLKYNLLR